MLLCESCTDGICDDEPIVIPQPKDGCACAHHLNEPIPFVLTDKAFDLPGVS